MLLSPSRFDAFASFISFYPPALVLPPFTMPTPSHLSTGVSMPHAHISRCRSSYRRRYYIFSTEAAVAGITFPDYLLPDVMITTRRIDCHRHAVLKRSRRARFATFFAVQHAHIQHSFRCPCRSPFAGNYVMRARARLMMPRTRCASALMRAPGA